jgi:hypothetical protein
MMTYPHHHGAETHPAASVSPSLLRLSALERIAVAAAMIALIWGAVWWAIH